MNDSPALLPAGPAEDLDPADWDAFRLTSHRMLSDMIDYVSSVRERATWQPVPARIRDHLSSEAVPRAAEPLDNVYNEFKENILPYPTGNIHPRFWGWVLGTGTPVGMMAELLAAAMNPLVSGHDQSARLVEQKVIGWLSELLGFPASASGVLVSGASEANLLGLAVARNARAGFDVRAEGLQSGVHKELVVYASAQTHGWIHKSCELLGIGRRGLRSIPVDAAYRIRLHDLRAAIEADRAQGRQPCCVIGNAGTVNTGATDDLNALADICRDQALWLHVDGAFGAMAALAPGLAHIVSGLDRADSVAFDLHKWGYVQYEAGVILVKDATAHRAAFAEKAAYLQNAGRGVAVDPLYFADLGIQLTRSFRALKVWMSLKTHGADAWGRVIQQNVDQAQYLVSLVVTNPLLELLAPAPLNVVCFRYRGTNLAPEFLDRLNEEILIAIQVRGIAVPSSTRIDGRFAIRVAHTNQRSRIEDFDMLVAAVLELGAEFSEGVQHSSGDGAVVTQSAAHE